MDADEPGPSHGYNLRKRKPAYVHSPRLSPVKRKRHKLTKQRVRQGKSLHTSRKIQKILDEMEKDKLPAPGIQELGKRLGELESDDEDPYENLWDQDE